MKSRLQASQSLILLIPLVPKIRWNGVLTVQRVDAELVKLKRRECFHVAVRKPAIGCAAVPGMDVCAGSLKKMELLGEYPLSSLASSVGQVGVFGWTPDGVEINVNVFVVFPSVNYVPRWRIRPNAVGLEPIGEGSRRISRA